MTMTIDQTSLRDHTVGDIAAILPGATAVFRKFKLDFCCCGDIALEESARRRGVDLAAVEQELAALRQSDVVSAAPRETAALINHILTRYHEVHRRELPELVKLARKVEAVHAEHPQAPRGLADLLQQMVGDLEMHMKKEELILFPSMLRHATGIGAPIAQMRHDHDDHGAYLRRLEAIANGCVLPEGACRSWQALYAGAAKLADDLMEHIHLENNLLFPRFEEHRAA